MTKKMKKESGFTLVEMLIVVAIIAILIAVSIPMVTGARDKARVATDQANERSAMAVALITYLSEDDPMTNLAGKDKYYVVSNTEGKLLDAEPTSAGYGKCKTHDGAYLKVHFDVDDPSEITLEWAGGSGDSFDKDPHSAP